jgi:hypothetical protein
MQSIKLIGIGYGFARDKLKTVNFFALRCAAAVKIVSSTKATAMAFFIVNELGVANVRFRNRSASQRTEIPYSYRSASIGSSLDAF